ncbi:hypothetical protein OPT61_g727 [Boeremia exigua]|uniref:Uncharacterized protein n=1 Tax=Boeremia exigua TaxID=749465 RepID=A0ACC2ISS4_9PLEO|nr:hypothetical protein OPT61_g727 [Boeremia exigua]
MITRRTRVPVPCAVIPSSFLSPETVLHSGALKRDSRAMVKLPAVEGPAELARWHHKERFQGLERLHSPYGAYMVRGELAPNFSHLYSKALAAVKFNSRCGGQPLMLMDGRCRFDRPVLTARGTLLKAMHAHLDHNRFDVNNAMLPHEEEDSRYRAAEFNVDQAYRMQTTHFWTPVAERRRSPGSLGRFRLENQAGRLDSTAQGRPLLALSDGSRCGGWRWGRPSVRSYYIAGVDLDDGAHASLCPFMAEGSRHGRLPDDCWTASCFYGAGQKARDLSASTISKGIKIFYVAEYFYAVSAAIIKCSISVTILRITASQRRYDFSIYVIMASTWVAAIVFCAGIASICKSYLSYRPTTTNAHAGQPIETLWGEANGTCNLKLNSNVSFFFSAIEILTDWSLAILPAIVLWKVQMKGTVKTSVAVILALASVASCATIVRLRYLALYSDPGEFMFGTGKIGFWSLMEEGIGIIAGSLPALRPLLSLKVRFSSSMQTPGAAASGRSDPLDRTTPNARRPSGGVTLDAFQTSAEDDEVEHDDGDSQKNIVKQTRYTVTSRRAATSEDEQVMGWEQALKAR